MTKNLRNKSSSIKYVAFGMIGLAILIFGYNIVNLILSDSPSVTNNNEIAMHDEQIIDESERVDDDETERIQDSESIQDVEKGKPEPSVSVIDREKSNAEKYFLEGKKYSQSGDYDKMLEAFDRSLELTDEYEEEISEIRFNNWDTFINAGIEEYNAGQEDPNNYRSAIELFELAAKIEPDSTVAYKNWGFAHLILGEMEEALKPFKETLEREDDPEIAKYTGQIYFDKGYDIWSRHPSVKAMDAQSRQQMENYIEESIKYLLMAMEGDPEDSEVVTSLSNAYIVLERQDEAMDIFRKGLINHPENKIYHYNLGILILEKDKFEEAEKHFENAIRIDPEYIDAHYNLGVTYVNWGVALREKSIAEGRNDLSYREKFEKAVPHLEYVTEKRTNNPELFETLGRLYANLDRVTEAEEAFNQADKLR